MTQRIFVPKDASARAVGADAVADAIAEAARGAGRAVTIVRTGSRGLAWLETLVEVETAAGRIGYGPVEPADVVGLVASGLFEAGDHPLKIGRPEELPFLTRQTRLTFARCGLDDPLSLADYRAAGGFDGFDKAKGLSPEAVIAEVTRSGLRGRGGAGFPAGIKWETVRAAAGARKFVVCNADEGDSGTFADRMLLEGAPFLLIEGMLIAACAVGAGKGYVYIRSEYPDAIATFSEAVTIARAAGLLSEFDLEVRVGAGSYVCGEETAMLESIEGRRGQVRAKPPLPAHAGLFGAPTLVNNVLTLSAVPWIVVNGGDAYAAPGYGRSRGTMPIQLGGDIRRGGLFEAPFGMTLAELVRDVGGGTLSGRPVRAVQVGGPLGGYLPAELLGTPFDYEALAAVGGLLGHGGIVVFNDTVDMAEQARFALEFCAIESCGKCTPCRIGARRGVETLDRALAGVQRAANLDLIADLCEVMTHGSLCALGGLTPLPVMSALEHFPEDFERRRAE